KDNIRLILQYSKIIEYCKSNNIDLIHCHLPWAGFLGRIIFEKTSIPMVYTEHNMQDRYHYVTKKINGLTFNSQSLALGVSQEVSNSIVEKINPTIPVKTLLNGVNTSFFARESASGKAIKKELNIPENAIVIGNIAVFRFQKRLEEWLEVFKDIESKNNSVYGIIVGAGQLEDQIKLKLKELNLESKVLFP